MFNLSPRPPWACASPPEMPINRQLSSRAAAGAVRIVEVNDKHVRFDFALTDAKIVVMDVDLVVILPDGARLILPGFALKLMDADAPPLHFTDGAITAEAVFAQFSDIKISEKVHQVKLTSEEEGEKAVKADQLARRLLPSLRGPL